MKTQFLIAALFILISSTVSANGGKTEVTYEKVEFNYSEIAIENEPVLQIENWMTDDASWKSNLNTQVNEEVLEIESWMTNDAQWKLKVQETAANNNTLEIEAWMTNDEMWELARN